MVEASFWRNYVANGFDYITKYIWSTEKIAFCMVKRYIQEVLKFSRLHLAFHIHIYLHTILKFICRHPLGSIHV